MEEMIDPFGQDVQQFREARNGGLSALRQTRSSMQDKYSFLQSNGNTSLRTADTSISGTKAVDYMGRQNGSALELMFAGQNAPDQGLFRSNLAIDSKVDANTKIRGQKAAKATLNSNGTLSDVTKGFVEFDLGTRTNQQIVRDTMLNRDLYDKLNGTGAFGETGNALKGNLEKVASNLGEDTTRATELMNSMYEGRPSETLKKAHAEGAFKGTAWEQRLPEQYRTASSPKPPNPTEPPKPTESPPVETPPPTTSSETPRDVESPKPSESTPAKLPPETPKAPEPSSNASTKSSGTGKVSVDEARRKLGLGGSSQGPSKLGGGLSGFMNNVKGKLTSAKNTVMGKLTPIGNSLANSTLADKARSMGSTLTGKVTGLIGESNVDKLKRFFGESRVDRPSGIDKVMSKAAELKGKVANLSAEDVVGAAKDMGTKAKNMGSAIIRQAQGVPDSVADKVKSFMPGDSTEGAAKGSAEGAARAEASTAEKAVAKDAAKTEQAADDFLKGMKGNKLVKAGIGGALLFAGAHAFFGNGQRSNEDLYGRPF